MRARKQITPEVAAQIRRLRFDERYAINVLAAKFHMSKERMRLFISNGCVLPEQKVQWAPRDQQDPAILEEAPAAHVFRTVDRCAHVDLAERAKRIIAQSGQSHMRFTPQPNIVLGQSPAGSCADEGSIKRFEKVGRKRHG